MLHNCGMAVRGQGEQASTPYWFGSNLPVKRVRYGLGNCTASGRKRMAQIAGIQAFEWPRDSPAESAGLAARALLPPGCPRPRHLVESAPRRGPLGSVCRTHEAHWSRAI